MQQHITSSLTTIQQFCLNKNHTLAVAESVSGGILQSWICSTEKAGLFFEGGMTLYNCRQKKNFLNLSEADCEPKNGVSRYFAWQMAIRTSDLFGSDIGISLTGFASPMSKFDVGRPFAYGAVSFRGSEIFSGIFYGDQNDAMANRRYYAGQIILAFSAMIEKGKI